ncbi:NADP oxidoreductase [Luteibacter rhizovicinus DSM 16549]|uniref:NADP oxidoreductase n=1 Tax=Luteibacter rhizovicinus DSM 16549 TaxID=1440763 RepID=A0A0G9HBM2_9GAMM|nr:NAD(P)-binding domain-containing protein [Luteibacter rhizovicinus]APG05560.1 NADP oxidoreductase [Luteibacter rhizovicinus DSM 16549]KLD67048.1 NADP oxidoreductase [Luteibacter rhizovicinus DSM 16549]KLD79645.1 NADP oxidoreductase [Xanthomonas hyacinthi DSM 19077]
MSTISIIGSGGMAAAIGGRTVKAGHTIEVISRDRSKAHALATQLDAGASTGTYGAAPTGDIVILAVPYSSAAAVLADYGDALDGKVIIDITNPISSDAASLVTPSGSSGAQEIAKAASTGAHVVKAFNTLFGPVLTQRGRLDAFFAADDPEAKARVSTFIESLGLRPLDVGGLHMAATLEAIGLMLIGLARNGAGSFDIALNVDIGTA